MPLNPEFKYTKEMAERDRRHRERQTADDRLVTVHLSCREARRIRDLLTTEGDYVAALPFEIAINKSAA